jgi:hypothetical protein
MLDGIFHLVKGKLLNHTLDTLVLCKGDSFLAVERVTAWPAVD